MESSRVAELIFTCRDAVLGAGLDDRLQDAIEVPQHNALLAGHLLLLRCLRRRNGLLDLLRLLVHQGLQVGFVWLVGWLAVRSDRISLVIGHTKVFSHSYSHFAISYSSRQAFQTNLILGFVFFFGFIQFLSVGMKSGLIW